MTNLLSRLWCRWKYRCDGHNPGDSATAWYQVKTCSGKACAVCLDCGDKLTVPLSEEARIAQWALEHRCPLQEIRAGAARRIRDEAREGGASS